jgi:hypothetical protein
VAVVQVRSNTKDKEKDIRRCKCFCNRRNIGTLQHVAASPPCLIIRFLVNLADTHLTIEFVQVARIEPNLVTRSTFGRGLSQYCLDWDSTNFNKSTVGKELPCSLFRAVGRQFLVGGDQSYKTLNKVSATDRLLTGSDADGTTYIFLGDVGTSDHCFHCGNQFSLCNDKSTMRPLLDWAVCQILLFGRLSRRFGK